MTEYTKGEWRVEKSLVLCEFPKTHGVVQICQVKETLGGTQGEANARLIAAAPKLYEACQAALVEIEDGSSNHAHLILAQALSLVEEK